MDVLQQLSAGGSAIGAPELVAGLPVVGCEPRIATAGGHHLADRGARYTLEHHAASVSSLETARAARIDEDSLAKSVVLVEYRGGEVIRWKNLKLIWQLVGDQDGFLRYVRDETRDFLAEG